MTTHELCAAAKAASRAMLAATTAQRNAALGAIASALRKNAGGILEANAKDVEAARKAGMRDSLLDRLSLDTRRVSQIADGVADVAAQSDPVGRVLSVVTRPNGLEIARRTVPLGVVAMIYEARPNVTVDAAALCLKAGNAVVLRGGKEAFHSNRAFAELMREAIAAEGLPADAVSFVTDTSRGSVDELMNATGLIDLLIPRGGAGLIAHVTQNARVPVVETGVGNCHVYAERSADLDMAAEIIYNAKCSRPSVCNAAETLLVDREIAAEFLPKAYALLAKAGTEIRGCPETLVILPQAVPATEADWETEFGDYILAVRVVSGYDEAAAHIAKYSSGHSECIVTNDYALSRRFADETDAAAVYVNASTRFTDGGEFGLGAEIGISTQKLHARGPMGAEQLTSVKYVILGSGQVR